MYPCACLRGDKWPSSGWVAGDDKVGLLYDQLRGQSREDLLSPRALDELVALAGVHRSETSWRGQRNAGPGWGQIRNLAFSGDVSHGLVNLPSGKRYEAVTAICAAWVASKHQSCLRSLELSNSRNTFGDCGFKYLPRLFSRSKTFGDKKDTSETHV